MMSSVVSEQHGKEQAMERLPLCPGNFRDAAVCLV